MKTFAIKTNTGISNYNGGELFFCYKIQSGNYTFYRTIENNLNRHYLTFNIKEIIELTEIDIKF
jgi:hypothetical protein